MERLSKLSDPAIDRLVAGEVPAGGGEHQELAAFMRDLRAVYTQGPTEQTVTRHLAAIADAARVSAAREAPAAVLAPVAGSRERGRPPRRIWRIHMTRKPLLPMSVRIAALGLALVGFGGAAYAGILPDPVQGPVADLAAKVGVSLPGGGGDTATPPPPSPRVVDPQYGVGPQYGEGPPAPAVTTPPTGTDQPNANQTDQPNANQTDQPDANQTDQPDANQTDEGGQGHN